jgi:2-succinyl-5-enolpyruvyl-6-hydroxy-3-cyclohexene-1-carboxylate synthase
MSEVSAQATFCATLVDEWAARGVRHAVVAPGSRNTPMALALAERAGMSIHVVHDERAAAFVALGLGLSGTPAVLLCTSGTAAANFHPAVVEADLSAVPLMVVTADRPPELRDVGAPQTIDQTHLYGHSVRWFHDPGVADAALAPTWRSLARRVFEAAANGPVHLNLPFRDPLVGRAGPLPPARQVSGNESTIGGGRSTISDELVVALDQVRGVILAGGRSGADPDDVAALTAATHWPVLADPTSGVRNVAGAVAPFDSLLRHAEFAADHSPHVIVRIGRPAASKVLAEWVGRSGATLVQVGGPGQIDPDHGVAARLDPSDLPALADKLRGATGTPWLARWRHAAERAERAIEQVLAVQPALTEPAVALTVARFLPSEAELVVASSMPVRDLEWYGGPTARAHANRGANGIDGVVSTALGVALGGVPTVALVGDVALVHDAGALTALRPRGVDLRIVVVDNDGGGIFSFLPQATELAEERFEQLFGTPHGTDVVRLAHAHGLDAVTVTTPAELADRMAQAGPSLTRVPTDRKDNVAVHAALNAAVAAALG